MHCNFNFHLVTCLHECGTAELAIFWPTRPHWRLQQAKEPEKNWWGAPVLRFMEQKLHHQPWNLWCFLDRGLLAFLDASFGLLNVMLALYFLFVPFFTHQQKKTKRPTAIKEEIVIANFSSLHHTLSFPLFHILNKCFTGKTMSNKIISTFQHYYISFTILATMVDETAL